MSEHWRFRVWPLALLLILTARAWAADTVNLGAELPTATVVSEGLFPDDRCAKLKAAGFQCQGVKPAVRFALSAASFQTASADLPNPLRQQLTLFAQVLKGRHDTAKALQIEGHTDASGSPKFNRALSLRRAEAVKAYLVSLGVDPAMLVTAGAGAARPLNPADPRAAENRRVEIGRVSGP